MVRTYVFVLLSFVLGCISCASASARIADDMDHRRWTASDQGPSAVGALAQTADGYLWLGTHDSLYRFDGFEFEKYTPVAGEPLDVVSALLSTAEGLWVGLRAGGVRVISPDGLLVPVDRDLPGGVIYGMAEDQQGQVWVAADGGLARHDGTAWHPVGKKAGFTERHARAVHVDADGYVWAASEEKLFTLPPGASEFVPIAIKSQSISKIASSPAGDIWITDRARGYVLRLKKNGYGGIEEIPIARTVSIVVDEHGDAWLGTLGSGVYRVASAQQSGPAVDMGAAGSFDVRDGLSSNKVLAQFIDRDGALWVGTDGGLDRLARRTLSPLALPVGAGSHALAVRGDDSLWVGTDSGQLIGSGGNGGASFELGMPITTLVNSEEHGLLVGGHRGIYSLSNEGLVCIATLPVETAREAAVRAIAVGLDGSIWVSVNRAGLFVWADQKWRRMEPVSDAERQAMPVTASRDPAGRLWFGYRDNLLVSVDEQKVTRWSDAQGLDIGHVTAMLHLPGRTWVGGQHGLAYLNDGRFHRLDLPAAGAFQNIYGLVAVPPEKNTDESSMDIWVHSRGGIYKLPASEIERVIGGGDTLLYSSHDQIGRLPMDPYKVLPVPTAVYAQKGWLWFATERGIVRVDPYQPRGMTRPPAVTIKSLAADGVDQDISASSVRLSTAPERLVISYSALNLAAPEAMHFQYRLNGHDSAWVDAGRIRQAVFPRLRPGSYEFQVRALGENEHLRGPDAELAVVIPQAFYLRPEFLLAFTSVLLMLVFWMARVYARREKTALRTRLEERFRERERIARELHDTLLQSAQGMMLSFQAVADGLPKHSHARLSMERALDRAEQVIAEGRDRITGLRGQMAPAEDLTTAFQTLQLEAGGIGSAAYSVSTIGQPVGLSDAVRDAFYQVGREAVFNSLRHGQATQIAVAFTYAADRFEMLVTDDGVGIDPLYQRLRGRPEHGGLRGMYERAERIGATLSIVSGSGKGTRISLSLPALVSYQPKVGDARGRVSTAE